MTPTFAVLIALVLPDPRPVQIESPSRRTLSAPPPAIYDKPRPESASHDVR